MINAMKIKDYAKHLENRYSMAYAIGGYWFQQLLEGVRYAANTSDGLNILYEYFDGGKQSSFNIWNNTPQIASKKRATDLHNLLFPVGQSVGDIMMDGKYDYHASKTFTDIIQSSNLHSMIHSTFLDINLGCGAIWIDTYSKEMPLVFKAISGVAVLPEFTGEPQIENVWFKRAINDIEYESYVDSSVSKKEGANNRHFLTCGFLKNRDPKGNVMYNLPNGDKYEWLYVEIVDDRWDKPITFEARAFKQLHLINDTIRPGDSRGTGIILDMLNDIRYLNSMSGTFKNGMEMVLNPSILANPKLAINNFDNITGKILPSTLAEDGVPLLQPLEWKLDIANSFQMIQFLENKVELGFNVMPYGSVEQTPQKTATEINARTADYQRATLIDISRQIYDFESMLKSCLYIVKRWGIIGKGNHDFTYRNPSLDIQNQTDLNNMITYKQATSEIINPNWFSMVNNSLEVDQYLKGLLNIPNSISYTPKQLQENQEKIQQFLQQHPESAQPASPSGPVNPQQPGKQSNISGFGLS